MLLFWSTPAVKIENRILLSIRRRPGVVLLRRDVAHFGSASQVSEALKALLARGELMRVGAGIYAKSARNADTGKVSLVASAEAIAVEIFQKLGVKARIDRNLAPGQSSANTLPLDIGSHRIHRRLSIAGQPVVYVRPAERSRAPSLHLPLRELPTEKVSQFVARLAQAHQVAYVRTAADEWADTATRLSGDEVRSDSTGDLLVALKRAHKLTDREMATLLINHLREQQRVRSV